MKSLFLWIIAFLITASSAVYQRMTGPTHAVRSNLEFNEQKISYKLERSHSTSSDYTIVIEVDDETISGEIYYKRYPTNEPWTPIEMTRDGKKISGILPRQPSAGKLEYYLLFNKENTEIRVPSEGSIIMRFKDDVPAFILYPHMVAMFIAMLFSTRAGIEALKREGKLKFYVYWTVGLLTFGGMILGPVMQKYAFGAFWTGFPFCFDLTDNKTLIAFLGWIGALIAVMRGKKARGWVLGASLLILIVYFIPHSLLGSELKYENVNSLK